MVRKRTGHEIAKGISFLSELFKSSACEEDEAPSSHASQGPAFLSEVFRTLTGEEDEIQAYHTSERHSDKMREQLQQQQPGENHMCAGSSLESTDRAPFDFLFGLNQLSDGSWGEKNSEEYQNNIVNSSQEPPKRVAHTAAESNIGERRASQAPVERAMNLARRSLKAWSFEAKQAKARKHEVQKEMYQREVQQHALSMWILGPGSQDLFLRTVLCFWCRAVLAERVLSSRRRTRERASPEVQMAFMKPAASPAPVLKALVAFSHASADSFVYGCFCAWRGSAQDAKRRKASMAWCLERMALSQTGLFQQAVFRAWCYQSQQNHQPAWALNLQHEMQNLLKDQNMQQSKDSFGSTLPGHREHRQKHNLGAAQALAAMLLPVLVCLVVLLLFTLLAIYSTYRGDMHLADSDGDGVVNHVDRCPLSAVQHKFLSSWQTDWDGDGCMDSVEDEDDDNDLVINSKDLCPRTLLSDGQVDQDGCSQRQRDLEQSQTGFTSYRYKIVDSLFEVIVGAIFTTSVSCLWSRRSNIATALQDLQHKASQCRSPRFT